MTDTTPAAIEALLKDVTPGPWSVDGQPWNQIIWSGAENRLAFMAHSNGLDDARDIATARFIAAARDLVPALAAERDAARQERDEAEFRETSAATWAVEYLDRAEKSEAEAAAMRKEVARLRNIVTEQGQTMAQRLSRAEASELREAALRDDVARIAGQIEAQVECTRETMRMAALPKNDMFTLEILTGHFLTMADDLRAALTSKGGEA